MKNDHAWTATELKALNKVSKNFHRTTWDKLTDEERENVLDMMNEYPHLWEVDERKAAKFYYNGKLVRTSKTHHYTHAVINTKTGKAVGCRSSREAAEAIIASEINWRNDVIANYERAVKAIEKGETWYTEREGRKSYRMRVSRTAEEYKAFAEQTAERQKEILRDWKVVELEER